MDDEQEAEAQHLRKIAWLAGEFYEACRLARLPDTLADALVQDWHRSILDPDAVITWDDDD